MAEKSTQPIIIKKKKGHGHGAHGGAWKVAYADFVTAMMAFFMVMWLLGSDEEVKAAVANYFNNPSSVLRIDLSNKEQIPMGDKTGAGESILKGAEGEVPEELVKQPSRPVLEGNTKADDPSDPVKQIASSGDKVLVEVMKFSVYEKDLFQAGSHESWQQGADKIFSKIGNLAKHHKQGKLYIKGSFGADTSGNYEFQVSRVVAVARYLVERKMVEEDRIVTSVKKKSKSDDDDEGRSPADGEPKIEFLFKNN